MLQPSAIPQMLLQLQQTELQQALPYLEQGLFGLEVVGFAAPQVLDGDWEEKLRDLEPLCRRLPGPISMHGPFLDLSPASPEPRLRALTRERYRHALQIAKALGARYLVLHTQFNPNLRQPTYPTLWLEQNLQFFSDLLPSILDAGTTVVLENMWDPHPDHLAKLLAALPKEQFAACLDAGHAHLHSQAGYRAWVEALGERLQYIHLSDNHGDWDEHLALGQGTVDFHGLTEAVRATERQPWYVFEVKLWSDVQASLRHLGWDEALREVQSDGQ